MLKHLYFNVYIYIYIHSDPTIVIDYGGLFKNQRMKNHMKQKDDGAPFHPGRLQRSRVEAEASR